MMDWYSGDISSAIAACQSSASVLLVYIRGDDETSGEMDDTWNDPEVGSLFSSKRCIALKLDVGSVGGQQFSQIYPVLTVPSTFFISSKGVPIEVIPGLCSKVQLVEKADKSLDPAEQQQAAAGSSSTSAAVDQAEGQGAQASGMAQAPEASTSEDKEVKVQRAKEMIQKKQNQRTEEEKQKEKNAELERRKTGKDLHKLKDFQAEREAREMREAIRKEKEETRIAREKVKEQIRRDREARSAQYHKEKNEKEAALFKKQQEKLRKEAEEAARIAAANSSNARIQFRLPDGSSITHTFEADQALADARKVVTLHASNPLGSNFRLALIVPRRVFTDADSQSSFRDLGLAPSAVLLVLPPAYNTSSELHQASPTAGPISYVLNLILSPLTFLWNSLQTLLFGNQPNAAVSSPAPAASAAPGSSARSQPDQSTRRVGRLSDLSRNGDDQNTWNGNSTQQM